MQLRDYQEKALKSVKDAFANGVRSALIVMPTGTGKTVVFGHLIDQRLPRHMVVAHREELIFQAREKIGLVTGQQPAIEMADFRADRDVGLLSRAPTVVSTVQTQIVPGRMANFKPQNFSTLVVDEAHRSTAESYQRVIEHYRENPDLCVLGVTATPNRTDESALGEIYDAAPFTWTLKEAIDDGWLVPIEEWIGRVDAMDLSAVHTRGEDFKADELAALMRRDKVLYQSAMVIDKLEKNKKTLIFCASVAHAESLCDILTEQYRLPAAWICGKTPKDERRKTLSSFAGGDLSYLCNVGVLTEGYDEPGIDRIVMARPTKSLLLYQQMLGRGTRPLPGIVDCLDGADERRTAIKDSAKPALQVIDLCGNVGRHRVITAIDALAGKVSDEAVELAREKLEEAHEPIDLSITIEQAQAEIARRAEQQRMKLLRQKVQAKGEVTLKRFDAFETEAILGMSGQREMAFHSGTPATTKQLATLGKLGMHVEPDISRSEASRYLDVLINRSKNNMATLRQCNALLKFGYDEVPVSQVSFEAASSILGDYFAAVRSR